MWHSSCCYESSYPSVLTEMQTQTRPREASPDAWTGLALQRKSSTRQIEPLMWGFIHSLSVFKVTLNGSFEASNRGADKTPWPSRLWVVEEGSYSLPSYVACSIQLLLSTKHFLAAYSSSLPHSHAWLCLTLELGWDKSLVLDAYSKIVHLNKSLDLSWLSKSNFTWDAPWSDELFPQQYDSFWDFCRTNVSYLRPELEQSRSLNHGVSSTRRLHLYWTYGTLKTSKTYSWDVF